MASAEKITELKAVSARVEEQLEATLSRLDEVVGEEERITEEEAAEVGKEITIQADEEAADKKALRADRGEAAEEAKAAKEEKKAGKPEAARETEEAEAETREEERVEVADLRTAAAEKGTLEEEKKKLEKKKITLQEMRRLIQQATKICRAHLQGGPFSEERLRDLNKIIADVRGKNDVVFESDEQIKELHESLTKRKIKSRKLYSMRRSLGDRAKAAIGRAERKAA